MNIFIDAEDMEERYGEELYKEYLERENKELKQKVEYYENFEINKTIDKIRVENNKRFKEQQEELESLKQINEEHQKLNGDLRVENERLNNIINELEKLLNYDINKSEEYMNKIRRSSLQQGDYPVHYYRAEWQKEKATIYLDKIKELKGVDKE